MSLFGTSPDNDRAARPKNSLFDDEPTPGQRNSSSLFDDDANGQGDSPWNFPTPKKSGRGNLVKTLLPADAVPDSYVDAYDTLLESEDSTGSGIGLSVMKRLFGDARLDQNTQDKILSIVVPGGQAPSGGIGRGEFNVLLALIGLAQEDEDVTLDSVDERRKRLPEPNLPSLKSAKAAIATAPPAQQPATPAREQPPPRTNEPRSSMRKPSFGLDADPWGSPALHKNHNHANAEAPPPPQTNGSSAHSSSVMPPRTTSAFTTVSDAPTPSAGEGSFVNNEPPSETGGGWGSYRAQEDTGFSSAGLGGDGFGGAGEGNGGTGGNAGASSRAFGGGRVSHSGSEEVVTVTAIPEKEGVFLFQHRNYQVASNRRNSKVVRRYSDFVWLLDCLQKRYPFRQLPLLPPKRVAINGNHIAADGHFLEKRRRGLARFANALVRHPVLSQEQLVIMFLTVPTELAVWRKQATISVQEEFIGKALPPTLEDSLPPNLQDIFDTVRSGVRRSAESYINLCSLMERLVKRNEGIAADHVRFAQALGILTEASADTYAIDTNDVPLLNEGINSTAKHLVTSQGLLEDEARGWDEGVLEDLKRQRDILVSMRDLFDRRDRYARDNIPQLEKRIQQNEGKLQAILSRPENQVKPGEAQKVEEAIAKDKQSIVNQHARGVFIKECVRDELVYFQQSQYQVSRLHQDWSQERVKYAELQADNWRALSEEVEGMPLGD